MGHLLLGELTKDGENVEDGEHLILETLNRVGRIQEDKTDEQGDTNAESGLGVDVGRCAPVLLEDTAKDLAELQHEGGGELAVAGFVVNRTVCGIGVGSSALEAIQFHVHNSTFRAFLPSRKPIDMRVRTRGSTNSFQHPFSRVGLGRAGRGTVALKIFNHGLGVLANVAKVDSLATTLEEKESVEALEEHGRRLVDGTQDGLSALGEFLKKIKDSPACLRIQTRGRLVDEQQQRRLRGQFDTDSQSLTLLDVETLTGHTDDGVSVLVHIQQLDNLIDVSELLLTGDMSGLAEQSTKVECLTDGSGL